MSRAPIRSMTGFARLRRATPRGDVVVSLRGVNHRGLDLHFHSGTDFEPFEPALRKRIAARVARGHIDVRLSLQAAPAAVSSALNRPLFEAWLAAFREVDLEYNLPAQPDLNAAFRIPGMLSPGPAEEPGEAFEAQLVALLDQALDQFNAQRELEGAHTAAVLDRHADGIRRAAAEMEAIRLTVVPALQARLNERLAELLASSSVLDPARLAQEAAILADRSDIAEEVTRLGIHARRVSEMLEAGGEVGKQLDILLQEMQRETNTILSKSNSAGEPGRRISELAMSTKSDIERVREQALNLE